MLSIVRYTQVPSRALIPSLRLLATPAPLPRPTIVQQRDRQNGCRACHTPPTTEASSTPTTVVVHQSSRTSLFQFVKFGALAQFSASSLCIPLLFLAERASDGAYSGLAPRLIVCGALATTGGLVVLMTRAFLQRYVTQLEVFPEQGNKARLTTLTMFGKQTVGMQITAAHSSSFPSHQ